MADLIRLRNVIHFGDEHYSRTQITTSSTTDATTEAEPKASTTDNVKTPVGQHLRRESELVDRDLRLIVVRMCIIMDEFIILYVHFLC